MFHQRPLTWLFIIATICVDGVIVGQDVGRIDSTTGLMIGFVLGQLGLLALWCVNGSYHRLGRAGLLVLATAVVAYYSDFRIGAVSQRLTIFFFYVGSIVTISFLSQLFMARYKNWQMPLIEIFGWTIVVAAVSYCIRYMQFDFLSDATTMFIMLSILALPSVFAICRLKNISDLNILITVTLLIAIIPATLFLASSAQGAGANIIFAQALCFFVYLLIAYLDDQGLEIESEQEPGTKESLEGVQLQLFEPGS